MKRNGFSALVMVAAVAVAAPSVMAQRPEGTPSGTAQPRSDSGGGGSASPRGGDSGSSAPAPAPAPPPPTYSSPSVERPSAERADPASQRRGGGNGSGATSGRAVPRGSGGGGGGGSTSSTAGSRDSGGSDRRAVPSGGRPREGRPDVGLAVPRSGVRPGGGGGYLSPGYYYPYGYYPYGYWGSGYGLGLGYFYDPFWPSFGYGYGRGAYGYGYDAYGYGGGGGYGYDQDYGGGGGGGYSRQDRGTGSLRLKIKPREAQVYVDGYLVGDVDSFDGAFQRLGIDAGGHRVELKAEGYEPAQFDVMITVGETVTYKGDLKPIR